MLKCAFIILTICTTQIVFCQNAFELTLRNRIDSLAIKPNYPTGKLYPNNAPQGIMVPSGWGGYGTSFFGSLGGAYPEVYTKNKLDMIGSGGFAFGNPEKFLNLAVSVNIGSLRRVTDFSANITASRSLMGGSSSITAGGIQLFADPNISDAPDPTFFVAFSHAVQWLPSKTPGYSRLSYTIGIGGGRFLTKSGDDFYSGKGKYGSAIFGSVSYEAIQRLNVNLEWSGINLGISLTGRPFKNSLSLGLGVTNLTGYSADKPNMVFTVGYPLSLNRYKL